LLLDLLNALDAVRVARAVTRGGHWGPAASLGTIAIWIEGVQSSKEVSRSRNIQISSVLGLQPPHLSGEFHVEFHEEELLITKFVQ
jgi:hypothetical protein